MGWKDLEKLDCTGEMMFLDFWWFHVVSMSWSCLAIPPKSKNTSETVVYWRMKSHIDILTMRWGCFTWMAGPEISSTSQTFLGAKHPKISINFKIV
jgi:hypothetical protein